ncbi:hypothetical protein E8E13_005620 [Curvularia kusanoi]|uniref:Uncharacterized protein n=1 Tax=Curvularia kusanoi TaxID=90978 RepID=A0A9P4W8U8_CURKU|nr:hypothetical protein E8E13_005620 [Curvularia kusanoi]
MPAQGATEQTFNDKSMHSHIRAVDGLDKGRTRTVMGWTAETCSFIISILALGGLVATLLVHQGKPLPEWPQLVTINSIISLFSLLMRACVGVVLAEGISQCKWNLYQKADKLEHIERLDSASRGAWGSFTLLFHFRPRKAYYVASLGATTTVLASLLGFFSQQLVQFQNCLEEDATAFTDISRTNSYARTGAYYQNLEFGEYPPMVAAINVGVLQAPGDLTSVLSSGCTTGNCTFSPAGNASFSTVTISHSCEDVTAKVRIINQTAIHNDAATNVSTYLGLDYGNNQTYEWAKDWATGGTVLQSWIDSTYESIAIYFLSRPGINSFDWKVANCSLSPTVSTYEARIQGAQLEETPMGSVPIQGLDGQFPQPSVQDANLTQLNIDWGYSIATNYTIRNGVRESCEGSSKNASGLVMFPKSTDEPTYVNATGHTNPSAGWKWWYYPKDCIWSFRHASMKSIAETLSGIFDDQKVTLVYRGAASGSAHLQVLWNGGNMTANSVDVLMGQLATSMTTVVRTSSGVEPLGSTENNAKGVVWVNQTCVNVHWRWIAFPAAMIGLTGLFLLWIAFENRGIEKDRLWKSSFLAALFCEVDMDEKPVGKKEMGSVAKSTSVSLEGNSGGLRLAAG